jgi:hypothetical protein
VQSSVLPTASDGDEVTGNATMGEDPNLDRRELTHQWGLWYGDQLPPVVLPSFTSRDNGAFTNTLDLETSALGSNESDFAGLPYESPRTWSWSDHVGLENLCGLLENIVPPATRTRATGQAPPDAEMTGFDETSGNMLDASIVRVHDTRRTIDVMQTTDSGYGTCQGSSKIDERTVIGEDNESVATDENHAPIPGQDKYLLEVAFAREICKRFSPLTQEQFALRSELMTELLYASSVMIDKRASSVAERAAASFVRRGRK